MIYTSDLLVIYEWSLPSCCLFVRNKDDVEAYVLVESYLLDCSCIIIFTSSEFFFVFSSNIYKFGALWHKQFELTKVIDTLHWRMLWEDFYEVFFAALRHSHGYKSWVNSICLERVVVLNYLFRLNKLFRLTFMLLRETSVFINLKKNHKNVQQC